MWRDGRIAAIGPASAFAVPEGALRIYGPGKYLTERQKKLSEIETRLAKG